MWFGINLNLQSIVFWLVLVSFSSCNVESIKFKKITEAKVEVEGNNIVVNADALFFNPNNLSGKIKEVKIAVEYNGNSIALIEQEGSNTKVPKEDEFKVPFEMTLPFSKIRNELLGTILTIAKGNEITLHYSGYIKIKVFGVAKSIPIEYSGNLKIL